MSEIFEDVVIKAKDGLYVFKRLSRVSQILAAFSVISLIFSLASKRLGWFTVLSLVVSAFILGKEVQKTLDEDLAFEEDFFSDFEDEEK